MDGHMVTIGATLRMLKEFAELYPGLEVSDLIPMLEEHLSEMDA